MNQPIRQKAISQGLSFADDASLFRTALVSVSIEITPHRRRTPNGDCIFRGFIAEKEIEVVIPASRQDGVLALMKALQIRLKSAGAGANATDASAAQEAVRQKLHVDGIWRARLVNETNGMPQRRFQLVVARWRYRGADGLDTVSGYLPST